jgi:phosphatidylinositol alpha 1,6-mannosyltransferase
MALAGCGRWHRYLRWVHNSCALTLCPSLATLADLRAHGFRRLRLWRRGVDTARFHVGRLATEKRIELLAEALDELTGVRLALVGDGPARPALERRFAGRPVHFAGFLRDEALATAYASADLFVFPSDTETFGQVIQEAMAAGLPVVAARAGGALDLVRERVTGALFAPGSVVELTAQMRTLVANPARRAALGAAGRAAAERCSWANVMDELLTQYQRVLRWRARVRGRAGSDHTWYGRADSHWKT